MGDDDAFGGSFHNQLYACVTLVSSIIGITASYFTILLITRMRTETGYASHILLVLMMSCFQVVYDISFFFRMVDCGYYIFVVANFFQIFSSIAVSVISDCIAIIALLIVVYKKKYDANQYFVKILLCSCCPGLFIGLLYFGSVIPEDKQYERGEKGAENLFYIVRLLLIFLNFVFCGIIIYQVEQISTNSGKRSPQEIAIRLLSRRMVFYPLVQALGRLCFAIYEESYGFDTSGTTSDSTKYRWLLSVAIVTPFVSVGYLIIFLVMQPEAKQQFWQLLCLQPVRKNQKMLNTRAIKQQEVQKQAISVSTQKRNAPNNNNTNNSNSRPNSSNLSGQQQVKSETFLQQRVINYSVGEDEYYDDDDDEALLAALDKVHQDTIRSLSKDRILSNDEAAFAHSRAYKDDNNQELDEETPRASRITNSLRNLYNAAVGSKNTTSN